MGTMPEKIAVGEKSKILVIGGTGYIGRYMVKASVRLGHPTFALIREATALGSATNKAKLIESIRNCGGSDKAELIESFKYSGVTLIYGDIYDHERLVEAMKKVDVVISTMGHGSHEELADQVKIINSIKEAGTIKRYFPSEFGFDVGRLQIMEPAKSKLAIKAQIREVIKEEAIPYTFVSCNLGTTYFLPRIGQVESSGPPTDKISILGDGNSKVIFVTEEDIGTYTINVVDDPRAMNKILYVRPQANVYSQNELAYLWEKKTGKTFERIYITEEEVLMKIQESPAPLDFFYAVALVRGEMTNIEIDPLIGVEATELYPEVNYTTVDELLDQYASDT